MMLCDELKYERLGDANKTYPASTLVIRKQFVDSAIDELKREHHRERHEYIDMVAQLKAKLVEQESENRKLKRALWLARANYCHNFRIDWYISRHPGTKRTRSTMENTLIIAELKCRDKANEYK